MTTTLERPAGLRPPVEFAPCDFTPYDEEDVTSGHLRDLREDPDAMAVAVHWLDVFWKPDYSKVELSGFVSRGGDSFSVWVQGAGRHQMGIEVEGARSGSVMVTPKAGFTLAECLGRDLITPVALAYLEASGYAPHYPWLSECKRQRCGHLAIEIQPI